MHIPDRRANSWGQFITIAYSPQKALEEARKDCVFRLHRRVGLRLAYVFYRLRVSANVLSLLRLVMSVVGVLLLAHTLSGSVLISMIGAILIYLQVVLDFSDGAIAKASGGTYPDLADQFDFLGCDVARIALLTSVGFFSGSWELGIGTLCASYVLVTFQPVAAKYVSRTVPANVLVFVTRWAVSDQWVVVILPFVLVGLMFLPISIQLVASALSWVYLALGMIWLLLAVPVRYADGTPVQA